MRTFFSYKFTITSFFVLSLVSFFAFSQSGSAGEYIQFANCGEKDQALVAFNGQPITCEFSRSIVTTNNKHPIPPLHVKWNLPGDPKDHFCLLGCRREDGKACSGATAKDSEGFATSSLVNTSLLDLKDDVWLDAIKSDVRDGNIYSAGCLFKNSTDGTLSSSYSNDLRIVTPCLLLALDVNKSGVYSFDWPGASGGNNSTISGTEDFLSKFYQLYQKMIKNKPTPDRCNPLKFDNGSCYVGTSGQYTPGIVSPHGSQGGAIDIDCSKRADGTTISTALPDEDRCSVVDSLISRIKEANGETGFSGIRECTRFEWATNGSSALHLHLDQSAVNRPRPCLFKESPNGYIDWFNCDPF
ncbi:MAG: hypothetical protein WCV68_03965 [Candidatus Paceibacterota bacterium]|jgi:hypothetical protein